MCITLQEQGILHAQSVDSGGAKLHITLLAAGFVIGEAHRLAGSTCSVNAFHAAYLLESGTLTCRDLTAWSHLIRKTTQYAMAPAGPSGVSVREISRASGADIRSWNDTFTVHGAAHQVRCVVVEGRRRAVVMVSQWGRLGHWSTWLTGHAVEHLSEAGHAG